MNVGKEYNSLIAEVVFLVGEKQLDHKRYCFGKIKRMVLRTEIKRLHKNNFESVNSNSETSSSNTNHLGSYVSVTDFKPMEGNYSSIKIIGY